MKKTIIILGVFLLSMISLNAENIAERVLLSTDKSVYVAGDRIWCSAFCVDAAAGCKLSQWSGMAYVELVSSEGIGSVGKIALHKGRGAGFLRIPATLPTGNYKIFAFTSLQKEEGCDLLSAAKDIEVFNTLSSARIPSGVRIVDAADYLRDTPDKGGSVSSDIISVSRLSNVQGNSEVSLRIGNISDEAATVSVSVYKLDGISEPANKPFSKPQAAAGITPDPVTSEYDGELIYADVVGRDLDKMVFDENVYATIATTGDKENLYSARITKGEKVIFRTGNIYGSRDLVFEIVGQDPSLDCHLEIESPFVNPQIEPTVLDLSRSLSEDLTQRTQGMIEERKTNPDTLYQYLPKRNTFSFPESDCNRYILDDYTRFPTMQECFVEFMTDVRARKNRAGKWRIQVYMRDIVRAQEPAWGNSLMLLDGVPVHDHQKIMDYDPTLLKSIDVYPYTYYLGPQCFNGIINFVSFKGDLPFMQFDDNVRIVDFEGAAYPVAFNRACPNSQTLLWQPQVEIEAGSDTRLSFLTPSYQGTFRVVVDGVTASGEVIRCEDSFEIR